jgi:FkbM family methyltransferase
MNSYKLGVFVLVFALCVVIGFEIINQTKKFIRSRKAKLQGQKYRELVFARYPNIPHSGEVAERMAVLNHINPSDKVLEIGANIGGVSTLIASMLNNPKHLVSVDPLQANCKFLTELGSNLQKNFNVFCGVVKGPKEIECFGPNKVGSSVKCVPRSTSGVTENLSLKDIQTKYNIEFTAAVIDCEGCYEHIFPQLLTSTTIKQVQIEWDGKFMEKDLIMAGFTLKANYEHEYLEKGVSVYLRN